MRLYDFGRGKWVFVDWAGIDPGYGAANEIFGGGSWARGFLVPQGISLKPHQGLAQPEPVIRADQPWDEVTAGAYASFILDESTYRCWYEAYHRDQGRLASRVAYAESDDGIAWRKPKLGLVEFCGDRKNALVELGQRGWAHGPGVFKDENPACPVEARYKMVSCGCDPERSIVAAVSADGLTWQWQEPLLKENNSDTQNIGWYNKRLERYVLYSRQWDGKTQRRGVNRGESAEFANFPRTVPVIESSPLEPPDWDIYCPGYHQWPGADHAHLMLLSVYHRTQDTLDVHLAVSRDERVWHRPLGLTPWALLPEHPEPRPSVYATSGILPTGRGEWSLYISASQLAHNDDLQSWSAPATDGYLRVPIREDGFMSLHAEGAGEFWTIPFELQSDRITVNLRTTFRGHLRYELVEGGVANAGERTTVGEPIDGFGINDCEPLSGDDVAMPLRWRGEADLSQLRGRNVRLGFRMFAADLYAIHF